MGGGVRKKACAQDSGRVSLDLELMNEEIGTRENKERTKEIKKGLFFFTFYRGMSVFLRRSFAAGVSLLTTVGGKCVSVLFFCVWAPVKTTAEPSPLKPPAPLI